MRPARPERLARLTARLMFAPSRRISLTENAGEFAISKTMVGNDLSLLDDLFQEEGLGSVVVERGRDGGATFRPRLSPERRQEWLKEVAHILETPDRVLPGGLLYYSDLLFSPFWAQRLGFALASSFADSPIDVVMTTEMKGIPLGMFTAHALGVPLAVCRFGNRPSDGSAVVVHYPSASGDVRTLFMGVRMLPKASRVLLVDDVMRGGSTLAGMLQVAKEFEAQVSGIGVFLVAETPQVKRVGHHTALLRFSISTAGIPCVEVQAPPLAFDGAGYVRYNRSIERGRCRPWTSS
ncbi:MAG TPA: phosphoribosyltransferase family protein [Synergistaceae bacterium]|nr:phosphoribosyltransferase family protein [Synergistaceae bacterium]HQH78129.1 phosphoribosyltransferase family protein [Synergistaceae bacterium]HQK25289.1 phosphoribosyltransferase family protein [Synergistaceae bacterium]